MSSCKATNAKLREALRELVRVADSEKHGLADLDEAAWDIVARRYELELDATEAT